MESFETIPFLVLIYAGILIECVKCSPFPYLVISEVNADTPENPETTEYIELWNTENCPASTDGYLISLFSGDTQPSSPYFNVDLNNNCIPGNGFFLIGSETLTPYPTIVINQGNFIQNGNGKADAIALYKGKFGIAPPNLIVDSDLVDVVVYDRVSVTDTSAFMPPLPSQPAVFEDSSWNDLWDVSMSKCSNVSMTMSAFTVQDLSPGAPNPCLPDLLTRWPSPCSDTVFAKPNSKRLFQYKITHDVKVTSAAISNVTVKSVMECSTQCSSSNLCTHFSVTKPSGPVFHCSLHEYCKTELTFSQGGIVGEKYYKMSAKNPNWPHEVPL